MRSWQKKKKNVIATELLQNSLTRKITLHSSTSTLYVVISDCPATDLFPRVIVLQVPRIERDLC